MTSPRPLDRISAFEDLAFGLFVHWGLYSQLARGEWVQHFEKPGRADYLRLMDSFTAEDFDADALVLLAKRAGMRYITLTARHHEGFSLYDTDGLSDLDVTRTPCRRDLVREFVEACHRGGIVPMIYHTTLDWNDPRFESDWDGYQRYLRASVERLCTGYGPIGGFWFDGNWSRPDADWQVGELYDVIRRHQPEAIIVNNTGVDERGRGGHAEVDAVTFERGRPEPIDRNGAPKYVAAEMCHTMNFHWGTAAKDFNFLSPAHVIEELCFARRAGANLLMNIGPSAQGGLPEYESAALAKVGEWTALHGGLNGPLYQGRPCGVTAEGEDFGLIVGDGLYLFVTRQTRTADTVYLASDDQEPSFRTFRGVDSSFRRAEWLDDGTAIGLDVHDGVARLDVGTYPYGTNTVVRIAKLSR
ncbi:MAG: alpha-L-fucosidase [Armatimonadetes bacterium]|nr:alpha-L-fucosidase [Armatimonadota bacterium]